MATIMLVFATALVFAIGGTPLARRLAVHVGVVDRPNERKIHAGPMPLLGGVAMYGAFLIALVLFADRFYISQIVSIIVGATWVSFLGIWDDRVGMSAGLKLIGQIFGGLILIMTGVTADVFHQPYLDAGVTLLWVVGITNAMNLMDNMDGLSGGVAAIASAFFLLVAALNGQYLVGSLTAALLGACIGFLVYNFNPATIFMGDTGSLFLGFMLAAVGLKLRFTGHPDVVTWLTPLLILGLPIFDTTLVFLSRLRRGLNPMTHPGQDHISHRLKATGLTARETVLTLYLVSVGLGVLAMFCVQAGAVENYVVGAAVTIAGLVALWRFEWRPGFQIDERKNIRGEQF
ncbi:MAG: undecaprenyl/decaprenyl-phosphate alpha-N-acetylglucosaminyl 1-phosphate transferase [Chloroflexi bacterium]|nr:undecaprenyl/decaprenyl-phosphate alpha-N-acetylglucosaminyl 1-phosphate transferase [Chloroflexota bacterium]